MSAPTLILAACLLLVCACTAAADDSLIGEQCSGDLLHYQKASTKNDAEDSFVVAYGGEPGVEISCITTQDLSPDNRTVSTLVAGGPGTRYAVLKVGAKDESDADFEVNIFGTNPLLNRIKRAEGSKATTTEKPRNPNPIIAAADDTGKIAKQLRLIADQLEAVQKLLLFMSNPFGHQEA